MTNLAKTLSDDFLNRHFIGYNQILDDFSRFSPATGGFPPYDVIDVSDSEIDIDLAVAGFKPEEISVTVERGVLTIEGEKIKDEDTDTKKYRYKGISTRSFKRSFRLAEYWEVTDAAFDNGILTVTLTQEIPEAQKPKRIDIKTSE
jgi:molecular chaperone IbpA